MLKASCPMGAREVAGEQNCFSGQECHRANDQHPPLPGDFGTHGFLHPSAFPDSFQAPASERDPPKASQPVCQDGTDLLFWDS